MNDLSILSNESIIRNDPQLIPYLSVITPHDKKLVREAIKRMRPNSKNYEDSWGYIIQATRYGGFKWYDSHTGSLIFFGRKSETDSTLVIPAYFSDLEYLVYIVNRIYKAFNNKKVILKNVNTEEIISLMSHGFRMYEKNEGWDKEAQFDDQTFPQLVVDLKKTIEARGSGFRNLRSALKKITNIRMRKYTHSDRNEVLEIFSLKDKQSKHALQKAKNSYFVSHEMYPDAEIEKYVFFDTHTKEILGFTATSDISSKITALVAALFKPEAKNANIWGIYQTFIQKYREGYQFANLGGCEFKHTYHFTREKFRPLEEIGKSHLVYDL